MLIESLIEDGERPERPSWTLESDLAGRLWEATVFLKSEKLQSISSHTARREMVRKGDYQIFKTEIATRAGCAATSLYNRRFSVYFEAHLHETNKQLEAAMNQRVRSLKSVGKKDRRRDELVADIRALERELQELRSQKTRLMVDEIFERLPLKVRRALSLS